MAEDKMTNEQKKELELKLQTYPIRHLFIKIDILDTYNNIIEEVSGSAISGTYNIDNASAIRRTCSITFNLENGYVPDENSIFWLNKKFQLFIGLKKIDTNDIYWFNKGVYAIKDPSISVSVSDRTITIEGLDKMALYNGDISGQLPYATAINVEDGAYVHNSVRAIMQDGGETNLLIKQTTLQIPYKIESAIGDTRWDVIDELTNLFYNYQAYYNLNGYFVFDKKPMYQSTDKIKNEIAIDFSKKQVEYLDNTWDDASSFTWDLASNYTWDEFSRKEILKKNYISPSNLLININRNIAYSNIKNRIIIYGAIHEDGYQPSYEIIVDNENYPNSPYTVEKLNERNSDDTYMYRTLVVQDDTYKDNGIASSEDDDMTQIHAYSIDLCKKRAEQELYLHQQATDKVTITCIPIYSLDVNEVIYLEDEVSGAIGEYVVSNISCGLGAGDTMTITANKIW